MNSRCLPLILCLALATSSQSALADISGHSSAICGGVILSVDELEKKVADTLDPTDFSAVTRSERDLEEVEKLLERADGKAALEAREKIAIFRTRAEIRGIRTAALLFSGDDAAQFLKTSALKAQEIGVQAEQSKFFKKWVISLFGVRALVGIAAIPTLIEKGGDKTWFTIPAAFVAIQFGRPVVNALLRMKKSALEKFLVDEFKNVGKPSKSNGIHILSMTGKSTSEYKTLLTIEENTRAPWAQEIIFDAYPVGLPQIRQAVRLKNPLAIPKKTAHIDLIAMPSGPDGKRQILVLTAEGI